MVSPMQDASNQTTRTATWCFGDPGKRLIEVRTCDWR
jgi:hypothetical protein